MKMENNFKKCPGNSVGVLVKKQDKILMFFRKTFPFGWAPPAGHMKPGESPEQAMIRKGRAEVGLELRDLKVLIEKKEFPNPCGLGYKEHDWWIFEARNWEGEPEIKEPDAAEKLSWFSPQEIRELAKKDQMDPAWRDYIFKELGIL